MSIIQIPHDLTKCNEITDKNLFLEMLNYDDSKYSSKLKEKTPFFNRKIFSTTVTVPKLSFVKIDNYDSKSMNGHYIDKQTLSDLPNYKLMHCGNKTKEILSFYKLYNVLKEDTPKEKINRLIRKLNEADTLSGINNFLVFITNNNSILLLFGDSHANELLEFNIEEEDILDELRCDLAEEQLSTLNTVNDLIEHQFNDTNNNLVIEYLIKFLIELESVDFFIETASLSPDRSLDRFNTPLFNLAFFTKKDQLRSLHIKYDSRVHYTDMRFKLPSLDILIDNSIAENVVYQYINTYINKNNLTHIILFCFFTIGVKVTLIEEAYKYKDVISCKLDKVYHTNLIEYIEFYRENYKKKEDVMIFIQNYFYILLTELNLTKSIINKYISWLVRVDGIKFIDSRKLFTRFSKQFIKLNDDIQLLCLKFMFIQLLSNIKNIIYFTIDSYTLLRLLFYLGYGKDDYTNELNHKKKYNISVVYAGESYTDYCFFRDEDCLNIDTVINICDKLKYCGITRKPLSYPRRICFNRFKGHISSIAFFFHYIFKDYIEQSYHKNWTEHPDFNDEGSYIKTDCINLKDLNLEEIN